MKNKLRIIGLVLLLSLLAFSLSVCFLGSGDDDSSTSDNAEISISGKLNYTDLSDTTLSSGNTIDFETTSYSVSITFTITNNGNATLNLTGPELVAISGAGSASFLPVTTNPASSIASGGSTQFVVTFTSDGSSSQKTATLTIESNDPVNASFSLILTGYANPT